MPDHTLTPFSGNAILSSTSKNSERIKLNGPGNALKTRDDIKADNNAS